MHPFYALTSRLYSESELVAFWFVFFFLLNFQMNHKAKSGKIHSCSHPVSALQTFVSRCVPRGCPAHTTVTRRIMFTLILLAQILPGQKFQVQQGCLALQIGFKCFSYLSDDTKAIQCGVPSYAYWWGECLTEIIRGHKKVLNAIWDVFCDLRHCMDSHKSKFLFKGVCIPFCFGEISQ